mmetsp:Transcript_35019/g.108390  ORF Transcript_35019/g.108390 Transcript_35019/m.108390 type:complete len:89 (+) Transcript_35019:1481-1747(+)
MLSSQLYIGTDVDASPASNDWIQVQTLASSSPLFFLRQIETRSMFWQDFKNGEKHQVYNCQTRYDQIISSSPCGIVKFVHHSGAPQVI